MITYLCASIDTNSRRQMNPARSSDPLLVTVSFLTQSTAFSVLDVMYQCHLGLYSQTTFNQQNLDENKTRTKFITFINICRSIKQLIYYSGMKFSTRILNLALLLVSVDACLLHAIDNLPAGPTTGLPDDGSYQVVRMRGVGTQNYICQKNEDDGSYAWALQFPLAYLWLYDCNDGTVDTSKPADGMHYFANIGSGAGWDLGTNCNPGTNPSDRACDTYNASWIGSKKTGDPQDDAIAWLLVEKDETNTSPMVDGETFNQFWIYSWMQRLDTVGGLPTGTCETDADIDKTVASDYECDYVLGITPLSFDEGAPDDVKTPEDCNQILAFQGEGVQEYQFWDGSWLLSQPQATLRAYSTQTLEPIPGTEGLVGSHYFANIGDSGTPGSGAGWVVGKDCELDTCESLEGTWRGKKKAGVANPTGDANIALLLVERDHDNTPATGNILYEYEWMQRLNTVDGVPPSTDGEQGERFESSYTCDYVLSICPLGQTTTPVPSPAPTTSSVHKVHGGLFGFVLAVFVGLLIV